jgi:hypothetical protein
VFFQFRCFFRAQTPNKVLLSKKLEESDEASVPLLTLEVVKSCIALLVTHVREPRLTTRAGQDLW